MAQLTDGQRTEWELKYDQWQAGLITNKEYRIWCTNLQLIQFPEHFDRIVQERHAWEQSPN